MVYFSTLLNTPLVGMEAGMSEFQIHDQTWHEHDGLFSIAVSPEGKLIIGLGEPVTERAVATGLSEALAEDLYGKLIELFGKMVEVDTMKWPNEVTATGRSYDMFPELGLEAVRQHTIVVAGDHYRCSMSPAPLDAREIVLVIQGDKQIALRTL